MTIVLNGTTGISGVDGSASTPSLQGNDTNTGIFYPAADTIAFAEGGVESMRLDSNGNVGIGTTSPNNKLIVNGAVGVAGEAAAAISNGCLIDQTAGFLTRILNYSSTTGSAIALYTGSTGTSTERMRIDASGNLGIGTSSPTQRLQVAGSQLLSSPGNSVYTYFDSTASWVGRDSASGALVFGANSSERMRIDTSGKLVMASTTDGLIGSIQAGITANTASTNAIIISAATANGPYPIGARGESTNQGLVGFFNSSNTVIGSITKSGNNVAYNTSSDYRLKENIAPMTGALDKIAQLNPVTYTWKSDGLAGQGFIAHELQEVVPECVNGQKDAVNEDGSIKPQGIDTSYLVATLTAAIQEQQTIINDLKARVTALEASNV